MGLSPQERELLALLRQYAHTPSMQIALVNYMTRWLEVDPYIRAELRRIRREERLESVEQPDALVLRSGAAEGLERLQLKRRQLRFVGRDGQRMLAESQEIVGRHPEDAG
jgi:exopolyphosphatase/pppGpp-phosphohydrolase